ncbi:VOC family protein [Streptomyces griseoviridis]
MTPSIRLRSVVLDCPDARALARFYAGFAGGTPEDADPEWVVLRLPDGPTICF